MNKQESFQELINQSENFLKAYEQVLNLRKNNVELSEDENKVIGLLTLFKKDIAGKVELTKQWSSRFN